MRRWMQISAYVVVMGLVASASLSVLAPPACAEKTAKATSTSKKTGQQKGVAKYIGNAESKKYHQASCEFVKKMTKNNRVEFSSPEQAEKAGYTACKICTPDTSKKHTKAKSGPPSTASEKSATNNAITKKSASQ